MTGRFSLCGACNSADLDKSITFTALNFKEKENKEKKNLLSQHCQVAVYALETLEYFT